MRIMSEHGMAQPKSGEIKAASDMLRGDLTSLNLYLAPGADLDAVPILLLEQTASHIHQLQAMLDFHVQCRQAVARPQEEATDDNHDPAIPPP